MPKVASSKARRHHPLVEEYAPSGPLKQKASKKRKASQEDEDNTVDSRASRRILKIGQDLVEEEQLEEDSRRPNPAFTFGSRTEEEEEPFIADDDEEAWGDEDDDVEEAEIDPTDQDIFNRFVPSTSDPALDPNNLSFEPSEAKAQESQQGTNLADLILEKIAMYEAAQASGNSNNETAADPDLPPFDIGDDDDDSAPIPEKAIAVYKTIGQLLSRQRSGPLPKPFKILPSLPPEQIVPLLDLTDPSSWTPYAHLQSVRLFISSQPSIAQPYLTTILLPRIRADIHETKKLHVHLYSALKKALYKPACFFKGLLFPLLEDGTCTLREAQIISSVITRVSVPVLHSAAALLRLCDIAAEQFTTMGRRGAEDGAAGATNIFIRCLLEKKYALPYKVVDALVFHFLRFKALGTSGGDGADAAMTDADGGAAASTAAASAYKLTVLWHQSLLAFAQRYRNDITEDQREALLDLVAIRGHASIGPEVRRELLAGRGRGVTVENGMEIEGGDDTMVTVP